MSEMTHEQRDAAQDAAWTDEDAAGLARAVAAFRDGLPPRQRDAFDAILEAATAAGAGEDVQGYFFSLSPLQLAGLIAARRPERTEGRPGLSPGQRAEIR